VSHALVSVRYPRADAAASDEADGADDGPATADDDARPSPFPIEEESRAPWL